MDASKTIFRRKDFFNGRKSRVMDVLMGADPQKRMFGNPQRARDTINRLKDATGKDGKVTASEVRTVMMDMFGKYHTSGAVRRDVTKNLGLPEITRGDIARYTTQRNALHKAMGSASKRTDLPQVHDGAPHATDTLPPVHNIPVREVKDAAKQNRAKQVRRMDATNQKMAKNIVRSADGYKGGTPLPPPSETSQKFTLH